MDKTLHKKFTVRQTNTNNPAPADTGNDGIFGVLRHEKRILESLAKDLLQPRQEAIAKLLEMARKV